MTDLLPAIRVLVVEDQPADQLLIRTMLKRVAEARITTGTALCLAAALEELAAQDYDCVLLDLHLPDAEGMDLVRRIVASAPDLPIVILTGAGDTALAAEAITLGAQDYLVKGHIGVDIISRAVRYAVDRHLSRRLLERSMAERNADLEAQAQAAEQRRLIFESLREGLIQLDDRGVILDANQAAGAIFRRPLEQLVGRSLLDPEWVPVNEDLSVLTGPEHPAQVALATGRAAGGILGIPTPEDGLRWVDMHTEPVMADGGVDAVVVTFIDVTEERAGRLELELAHDRFAALVEHSADPIIVYDDDYTIRYASPALGQILGGDLDRRLGHRLSDLVHPDDKERFGHVFGELGAAPGAVVEFDCRMARDDGSWRHIELTQTNLLHDPAVGGFVGNARDVTERVEVADRLTHQAMHDGLTGLPNRALFLDRLELAVARASRRTTTCGLLYLDLDRFKPINDSLGHAAGDELLVIVADRLRESTRAEDTVARLGGDEFVVLAETKDEQSLIEMSERIRVSISRPITLQGQQVGVGVSIGIAVARRQGAKNLLQEADAAMYQAKEQGRDRWEVYSHALRTVARHRVDAETEVRDALDDDRVVTVFQPIVALPGGDPVGAEALVRLRRDGTALAMPDEFIDSAENSGLILPLGRKVLDDACAAAAAWSAHGDGTSTFVSVNFSARQLADATLVDHFVQSLSRHGLEGRRLCVELTENAMVDPGVAMRRNLGELRDLGVVIAIDRFGTGTSTLSHLRRFPVDILKIDRTFISGGHEDLELVRAIIGLGHGLGRTVVAVGVETERQADLLTGLGCDCAQGYLYGRPGAAPLRGSPGQEIPVGPRAR